MQSIAIRKVQPAYPAEAKTKGISGEVRVQITISEAGEVHNAVVVDGPEPLREAALEAARHWSFKPMRLSGNPVSVTGVLTFKFTLQ